MERMCNQCRAVLSTATKSDWCPACGGAIIERAELDLQEGPGPAAEIDHRGILLPRRFPLGGIITPQ